MIPILLLFLVGGAVAVAVSKSSASPTSIDGLPSVSSLSVLSWETPKITSGPYAVTADKLNTRGQKFIDPAGIARDVKGYESVMSLPSDGKARMNYIHSRAQTTIPRPVPAGDVLMSAATGLGTQAAESVKRSLSQQKNVWIERMRQYGRMSANGYVIALTELTAAIMKAIPVEWDPMFQQAKKVSVDAAEKILSDIVLSIAYGCPYPMHILDDKATSPKDLINRLTVLERNLGQFVTLPTQAKGIVSSWFALLAMNSHRDEVQRAIIATDDTQWGKENLASDDQVYLVAAVFAAALGEPVLPFAIELWNRSKGWSRWRHLVTNDNLQPPLVKAKDGVIAYDQSRLGGIWSKSDADSDTGYSWAFDYVTNARALNWLDITLTGWEIVAERSGNKLSSAPRLSIF